MRGVVVSLALVALFAFNSGLCSRVRDTTAAVEEESRGRAESEGLETRPNRRTEDVRARLPAVHGGGKIVSKAQMRAKGILVDTPSAAGDGERLLEVGEGLGEGPASSSSSPSSSAPQLPEKFVFLEDPRFSDCYAEDHDGQGSCNTCWAFATQKMYQARRCAWAVTAQEPEPRMELSPLGLICANQAKLEGTGVCEPNSVVSAFTYLLETGLPKASTLKKSMEAAYGLAGDYSSHEEISAMSTYLCSDASRPTERCCEEVRRYSRFMPPHKPDAALVSSQPFNAANMMRMIMRGPVVAIIRLTWEFLQNTAAMFAHGGKHTFCRIPKADDHERYCDPALQGSWDADQLSQQTVRDEELWYNHFIVVHGWGVREGARYWVLENSWGPVYDNDPSLGNNGAGPRQGGKAKNHFVLLSDGIAGRGGLEMTNREVFTVRKLPAAPSTAQQ